jgi:hypothetical protein
VILITKKLILLTKVKKDKKIRKNQQSYFLGNMSGTCFELTHPFFELTKDLLAQRKTLGEFEQCSFELGRSPRGKCAPLEERWCIPREGCPPLERWCPSSPL